MVENQELRKHMVSVRMTDNEFQIITDLSYNLRKPRATIIREAISNYLAKNNKTLADMPQA
ncbi:ribbon-helix-helix domain-containing protein [Tolypothrix sp. VBCCA 56010]|uniref:ribbon-helix-helix domain-containing protein n=1 Tax=Tolypothrix sp. VBCCA 56010 TaxID=3137731 RepID=UPI003D7DCD29